MTTSTRIMALEQVTTTITAINSNSTAIDTAASLADLCQNFHVKID